MKEHQLMDMVCLAAVVLASGSARGQILCDTKLIAGDSVANHQFGHAVSIDGDTAVIGAVADDDVATDAGAAYVFVFDGTNWIQQAKLTAGDGAANDVFGRAVDLDGDTVIIGSFSDGGGGLQSGAAYVFVRNGTTWMQQAKLFASDGTSLAQFGLTVSLDGDTAAVGAHNTPGGLGKAYVFVRDGASWSEQAILTASDGAGNDFFGISLDLEGDTLVVAADADDVGGNVDQGSAYVFTRSGTTWTEQTKLITNDGAPGDRLGLSGNGTAVSLNGDTVVIGAHLMDDNGTNSGSAYVFTGSGATWVQEAKLLPTDGQAGDVFGWSVSLDGDGVLIGAFQDDDVGSQGGSAYRFTRNGTTWSQQAKLLAADGLGNENFGFDVALQGATAMIGAQKAEGGDTLSGAAYVCDVPECFLVVGDGPGASLYIGQGHMFSTQVGPAIEEDHAVLMDDIPEFVLPIQSRRNFLGWGGKKVGPPDFVVGDVGEVPAETPSWMLDMSFAVQVLMWNPEVFPQLPEQYTAGLQVTLLPNGSVSSTRYGTSVGGMDIWHEVDVNDDGQRVIRFPFDVPGL